MDLCVAGGTERDAIAFGGPSTSRVGDAVMGVPLVAEFDRALLAAVVRRDQDPSSLGFSENASGVSLLGPGEEARTGSRTGDGGFLAPGLRVPRTFRRLRHAEDVLQKECQVQSAGYFRKRIGENSAFPGTWSISRSYSPERVCEFARRIL